MKPVGLGKWAFLFIALSAVSCPTWAQSKEELIESRSGIAVGFDPTPVEIPNVQKTTPRPVACMDLLTLRDFSGMKISPDGNYVAFVLRQAVYETNSYRTGMFVMSTAKGSRPVSLGTAGPLGWDDINQAVFENPQWSPDDKYIYRTMKRDGVSQVWRWKRAGGAPEQVTRAPQNVQNFYLSQDGSKLLIMLAAPSTINPKQLAEQGILYDGSFEATGQPIIDRIASTPGGDSQPWILDLGSSDLSKSKAHKATEAEIAELNLGATDSDDPLGTGMRKIFTQKEIDDLKIISFAVSPDHKMVAYEGIVDDPTKSKWTLYPLMVRPLAGGPAVTAATWDDYQHLFFWWDADSKEIYVADTRDDPGDPNPDKIIAVPARGGEPRVVMESSFLAGIYSTDRSNRFAAFLREDSTTPSELAFADFSTGEVRLLAGVNPEVQNLQVTPARRIDVTDKQGEHFWGYYVLPLGYQPGKRYPLVITTYVDYGEFLRGAVGDEYPIQVFAANGFVVLNFNAVIRSASNNPNDFESTLRQWQGPIEAMEGAVAKLSEMGIVDRARVAVTGLSHGGDIVNYGIAHSDLFRVAIDSGGAGARDPISYYLAGDIYRTYSSQSLGLGLPEGDMLAKYKKVSVALNAANVHTPLLINASDAEYTSDMQRLNTLRALKKPVEMFIYPNERHEKNQPKHRSSIYQRNVDWLNFWLNGKEDSDPAKAEQYKRWHELRQLDEKDRAAAVASAR